MKKCLTFFLLTFLFMCTPFAQVSFNMNLLDQWDESGLSYNDCWGYVDGNNNEYAILGSFSKIHFFQITANDDFILVDEFTPGSTTVWRDFKTYGNKAYAVSEGNEGLLVYDLSNLPNSVSLSHEITSEFTRAHNIYLDEANGKLYVAGSNTQSNGLIIYDVTTSPPTHLASVSLPGGGYVHDLYVKDNTAYCSHGNNGFFIWDVSTPTSPSFLTSFTGEQGYNHSSWVTPDGNTAFYAREVGVGLPMTALDISNYNDLEVISNFKYPLLAPTHIDNVPHNPYLVGDYLYTSYYEDGVQVFDVSDPANVTQAAYYDTYPSNTQYNGYEGCWGVYPFLPSGRILASDDINGLFLLELDISNNPPLVLNIINQSNIVCNGENTGSVEVEVMGGVPPYTYSLDNGAPQTNGLFENLLAGTYNLKIIDAVGATNNTPIIISEPSAIVPSISLLQNITCFGNSDGAMIAQASGGTISISHEYSIDGVNFSTNNTFTNLSGGAYTLSVRDDNNCQTITPFSITQPPLLEVAITQQTNLNCFGNNIGEVILNGQGGLPNYQYNVNGGNYQNSATFSNLAAGNYNFNVKDANDCVASISTIITAQPELVVEFSELVHVDCFGGNTGSISINISGGESSYSATLNGNTQTGNIIVFENLMANNYSLLVEDGNGCTSSQSIEITENPEFEIFSFNNQNPSCFNSNDGLVEIIPIGGTGTIEYFINSTPSGSNPIFENLSGGVYIISAVNDLGCEALTQVELMAPSPIIVNLIEINNVSCGATNDGSVILSGTGGVGELEYILNGNTNTTGTFNNLSEGNYTVIVSDKNDCIEILNFTITAPPVFSAQITNSSNIDCNGNMNGNFQVVASGESANYTFDIGSNSNTTGLFENLGAGFYNISITDDNNCQTVISTELTEPNEIAANISNIQDVSCFGQNDGNLQIQANGGTGNLTYTLENETNSNGVFQNLQTGLYNISITDQNNCQNTIQVQINQPNEIAANISNIQDVSCFGQNNGSLQIQANGGTGNLTYTLGNESNSNGLFQNLQTGIYNISITDQNNCQNSIQVQINQPNEITSSISNFQDVSCFGQNDGSLQIQANSGTGNLTYSLGNESNSNGLFQNLQAGFYNITITDENNCFSNLTFEITEPQPLNLNLVEVQNINCNGDQNGLIQVNATGGSGNFQFTLGNATNSTGLFQNLSAGTYEVIINDANNCEFLETVILTEPSELNLELLNILPAGCDGAATGSFQVLANGGTGTTYTYTINNQTSTNGLFENIPAGVYDCLVTDETNCSSFLQITVNENSSIALDQLETINIDCFGNTSGSINITSSGGTGTLNYSLDSINNTTGSFDNLPAGNYNIIVSDEANCSSIFPIEIIEPSAITAMADTINEVNCFGESTGSVLINAMGGVGNYNYSLDGNLSSDGWFENLSSGNYTATAIDANNCFTTFDFEISEPNELLITIDNLTNDLGNGEGSATISVAGGTPNYTYSLDGINFQDGNVFENLVSGNYTGYVKDANECLTTIPFTIEIETTISNLELGIQEIQVLPNPFSEKIIIRLDLSSSQNLWMEIRSMDGKNILQKKSTLESGQQNIYLNVKSTVPTGIYILSIRNEEQIIGYFKLIKI